MRNGVRFRGGGRAQVPSLPVDDTLTSDKKGVCLPYTQCLETVLNLPLPGIVRTSCFGRFSPLPTATTLMDHKDIERQVTDITRSFRE